MNSITATTQQMNAATTLDKFMERLQSSDTLKVEVDGEVCRRSVSNPMAALAMLAALSVEDAAEVAAVDVAMIEGERLKGRIDHLERGIGRLALVLLSKLRIEQMAAVTGVRWRGDDPRFAAWDFANEVRLDRVLATIKQTQQQQ